MEKEKLQIECFVFKRQDGEYKYLLLKRIPQKGGFWQPPCGKVDPEDKSLLDAAYREVLEETTIVKGKVINVLKDVHSFEVTKHYLTGELITPIKESVYAFEVDDDCEVKIDGNIYVEHEEFRWVSFEEGIDLLKWKDNKEALRKLNALLNTN